MSFTSLILVRWERKGENIDYALAGPIRAAKVLVKMLNADKNVINIRVVKSPNPERSIPEGAFAFGEVLDTDKFIKEAV